MHKLDARERYSRSPIRLETEHGSDATLDRPVVLFDEVVKVRASAN